MLGHDATINNTLVTVISSARQGLIDSEVLQACSLLCVIL